MAQMDGAVTVFGRYAQKNTGLQGSTLSGPCMTIWVSVPLNSRPVAYYSFFYSHPPIARYKCSKLSAIPLLFLLT